MTPETQTKPAERLVMPFHGEAPLLQSFGENAALYKPYGLKGHNGLDFGLWTGTAVLAMASGKVLHAGDGALQAVMGSSAGISILTEHTGSQGLFMLGYAHLESVFIKAGDWVEAGDCIGISGATGAVTGDHLHVELLHSPLDMANGYLGRSDLAPLLMASHE